MMPYFCALQSLHREGEHLIIQDLSTEAELPPMDILRKCASLSEWMYKQKDRSRHKPSWKFLHSKADHRAFLIFRGTDPRNPVDLMTDILFVPTPVYPTEYPLFLHREDAELSAHGGIESAVAAAYETIKMHIAFYVEQDDIDRLYITSCFD